MSTHCEEVRPLLAELVYGEVDPEVADTVREHLGTCLACRRYQKAFEAVRGDLQNWQPAAKAGRSLTFIAPAPAMPPSIWSSRALRGLAVAASFVFGVFLMAAATNLQVHSNADGWTLSTSLWNPPAAASLQQAADQAQLAESPAINTPEIQARPVSLQDFDQEELGRWFDEQSAARGLTLVSAPTPPVSLTDAQWQQVSTLVQDRLGARDTQHEEFLRDLIAASETRQYEQLVFTLASLYDNIAVEHGDELFEMANQLGVWQIDTERRLQQANTRIDNLVTQVSSREREPER